MFWYLSAVSFCALQGSLQSDNRRHYPERDRPVHEPREIVSIKKQTVITANNCVVCISTKPFRKVCLLAFLQASFLRVSLRILPCGWWSPSAFHPLSDSKRYKFTFQITSRYVLIIVWEICVCAYANSQELIQCASERKHSEGDWQSPKTDTFVRALNPQDSFGSIVVDLMEVLTLYFFRTYPCESF